MTLEHQLAAAFLEEQPAEAARVLEKLPADARTAVLRALPSAVAGALREMPVPSALECLSRLSIEGAGSALGAMPADVAVTLLRRMPRAGAQDLIDRLPPERRDGLRHTLHYPSGTAGALMDLDVVAVPEGLSVAEARVWLRRSPHGLPGSAYVVDRDRRLVGVIDVPELLRAGARETMAAIMRRPVDRLAARMPAAVIRSHPGWRSSHTMPVVDDDQRLIGVIPYRTIRRLEREGEAAGGLPPAHVTVTALGELFHLGLASFVEGVAAASVPRAPAEGSLSGPRPVERDAR